MKKLKRKGNLEFELLSKYLSIKGINTQIKDVLSMPNRSYYCLEWKDVHSQRKRVYEEDILVEDDNVLAYQIENYDESTKSAEYYLQILKDQKEIFTWKLIQLQRDNDQFENLYLAKHKGHIIHIHKHDLYISILSYKDEVLSRFSYFGELINRKGDIISFERIYKESKERPVELIQLPTLEKLDSITYEEAKSKGFRPTGNFKKDFLKTK